MKTLTVLLAAIIALSSCSLDPTIEFRSDYKLKPYVDKFYLEAEKRGIQLQKENLTVVMDNTNKKVNPFNPGVCIKSGGSNLVVIDQWTFEAQDYTANELMIFHELGHALLNKKHNDIHECIMNTSPNPNMYKGDVLKREIFINDLFLN